MKFGKINLLLTAMLGAALAFTGCSKDDGAIKKKIGIEDVPVVTTNIDATGSQAINMLNLGAFQGKFKVDMYFPGAKTPDKVDIVVRKNGSAANVKVFKAGVTTYPSNFTVTAAELAALFGTPVALGDSYDFAPNIYVGDKVYEAFPNIPVTGTSTAIGSGTFANAFPGFGEFARFAAICAYDPAIYEGDFVVVSDAFGDFSPGEIVKLTRVSATSFSFINPYVTNPLPVIVTVNTLNNNITIAKQKVGNAFTWNTSYTNPNMAATSGSVAPCDKRVTMNIAYTVDQGSFGTFALVLRKP